MRTVLQGSFTCHCLLDEDFTNGVCHFFVSMYGRTSHKRRFPFKSSAGFSRTGRGVTKPRYGGGRGGFAKRKYGGPAKFKRRVQGVVSRFAGGQSAYRNRSAFRRPGASKHSRVLSYTGPVARAIQAFKTNQMTRWSQSAWSYFKGAVGKKSLHFMIAGDNVDLTDILNNAAVPTSNADLDYGALKNLVYTATFKNVSTYQQRFRVTTWRCKHDLQQATDLPTWYAGGFSGTTRQVGNRCLICSLGRARPWSLMTLRLILL